MNYKAIFYFGLGFIGLGTVYSIFTKDISYLWISGTGTCILSLALITEKLNQDWMKTFMELQLKMSGTTDCVRACYADIDRLKGEMNTLKPDSIEELEMRVENLEAANGIRSFSQESTYRPKPHSKLAKNES